MTPPGQSDSDAPVGFHTETTLCLDCGAVLNELGYEPITAGKVDRLLYQTHCDRCGQPLRPRVEA